MAHANINLITFDDPDYVAGSVPPNPPWSEAGGSTTGWGVVAGIGYAGTQGLAVDYPESPIYTLANPLTSAKGAQRVSILFDPAGLSSSQAFYTSYGGCLVGRAGYSQGIVFRQVGQGNYGIYGPGSGYGTYMGAFTPSAAQNWYEISFELNDTWDTLTVSAGVLGATPVSMENAWDGGELSRVMPVWGDSQFHGAPGYYDNLAIPEPTTLVLLALGGFALIRRRRVG